MERSPRVRTAGASGKRVSCSTGWPDRAPAVPKGAYTDLVAPHFGVAALVAALIHRERTGQGQYIEMSSVDTGVMFLSPELIELQLTGKEATRRGNDDLRALVHGVFPCKGKDEWIAIEVWTELEWDACIGVLSKSARISAALEAPTYWRNSHRDVVESAIGILTNSGMASSLWRLSGSLELQLA